MIYFKDRAIELGCTNIEELGDYDIWLYIIERQNDE